MRSLAPAALSCLPLAALLACGPELYEGEDHDHDLEDSGTFDPEREPRSWTACDPTMSVFPVGDAHNIGYDHGSCGSGTCDISCPDANANSDWGGSHHGIDIFAYQRAPLVAVASGQIVATGEVSSTSGLRVRLEDACNWEYYYGHMDEILVSPGQWVEAGDLLGYMGHTGTGSTHLHFNVSPDGSYYDDIDPYDLLVATSPTACGGSAEPDDGGDTSSEGSGTESPEEEPAEEEPADETESEDSGSSSSSSSSCGIATGTTYLTAGDSLSSCDGRFHLHQQSDGNLVLYTSAGEALWHAQTHGYSGAWAAFQSDGNLVVYSSGGSALWASGTQGHPSAWLHVQDDGNLVIYDGSTALWHTDTWER